MKHENRPGISIILILLVVDQKWKANLNESLATKDTVQQHKSTDSTVVGEKEKEVENTKEKGSEGNGTGDAHEDRGQESKSIAESNPAASQIDKTNGESSTSQIDKTTGESTTSQIDKTKGESTTLQIDKTKDESSTSEANNDESKTSTENQSSGLYFATREEAIAFGFSRFSAEEIQMYNRVSANGLTPEQEEVALQIAYSRFLAEEIAAIEDALNR